MSDTKVFIDTNILLYLLSSDTNKADKVERIIEEGGLISVQVLNEMTNVMRRKLAMPWPEIKEILKLIRFMCQTVPLTIDIHDKGRFVAERYTLSVYDSMIIAAALIEECNTLYSEDMQDGMMIDHKLQIVNPFCQKS